MVECPNCPPEDKPKRPKLPQPVKVVQPMLMDACYSVVDTLAMSRSSHHASIEITDASPVAARKVRRGLAVAASPLRVVVSHC
jgi:hypothetical protein